jgi:hypothetical protein
MVTDYAVPMEKTFDVLGPGPYSLQQGIDESVRWLREEKSGNAEKLKC